MKELYELGFVFRGFVLVNHILKELPIQKESGINKDLRGAFISAINTFVDTAFNKNAIEYLESGNILFIFKIAEIQSEDNHVKEPIIVYGLVDKSKKKSERLVRKFFEKIEPVLQLFIQKYNNADFTELNQFEPFQKVVEEFFIKKETTP
ncbi:MAG: hypothetical protein JSV62_01175 [Promethearchaeota archaeon]|nr:MAG: hypothetical protein JSV62_01175 [Candidatus Lokiarchaeota archaeon]